MSYDQERGGRIRTAMNKRGWSKTHALAAKLKVSVAAVSRWQNGGHISLYYARVFAEALDVSLDWLLLGRGSIDWHKHKEITDAELRSVFALRRHPSKIRTLLTELIVAIPETRQLSGE